MPDLTELLTYYVIVAVVFIGAPGVFFFIVFMPALQNTKGRMVGYKDHKTYGNSTIYEVNTERLDMPNPDALWQDIQKLDDMYEELMWHPDDELQFTHDGEKIIITNKTLEEKNNV